MSASQHGGVSGPKLQFAADYERAKALPWSRKQKFHIATIACLSAGIVALFLFWLGPAVQADHAKHAEHGHFHHTHFFGATAEGSRLGAASNGNPPAGETY